MSTSSIRNTMPPQPLGLEAVERQNADGVVRAEAGRYAGDSPGGRPFPWNTLLIYCVLVVGGLILIVPFVWMVKSSLSTEAVVQSGEITTRFGTDAAGQTVGPQFGNYVASLERMGATFVRTSVLGIPLTLPTGFPALSNTVFITTLSIAGQILSCSLVGFGFARFKFRGRGPLFLLMLSTMMLPPQVTMIPVFILFRSFGMIDTFWPLVLPMWLASPFFVFMFRQFFAQVPEELMEAARIDGASNLTIYWRMMLPLSGPVIAIVAIYTFMTAWNDFMNPLIYLNSPEHMTLALRLNAFKGVYGTREAHLLMAASFLTMLPCILLFFAAQRYFVDNVASSGLKS